MKYYVRDTQGRVAGPFGVESIKKAAEEGKILPSWHLSSTQEKWTLAANVPNLFPASVIAPPDAPLADLRSDSIPEGPFAVFLDTFKGGRSRFKEGWQWTQKTRLWWAKVTCPSRGFIITEIGPKAITRLRYSFTDEQPVSVSEKEYEVEIRAGLRQVEWYVPFSFFVMLTLGIWSVPDFGEPPKLAIGSAKLAVIPVLLILGYVYKAKRSRIFIGYTLDLKSEKKLDEIRSAFGILARCSHVWALRARAGNGNWKSGVGNHLTRLPAAKFVRSLPRIQMNKIICGVAYHQLELYFLPEMLLAVDGHEVRLLPYRQMDISQDHVDYLQTGWQRHTDSLVVGNQWLHSRVDGQQDRRFKVNYQIPIVRLGILAITVPDSSVGLITTNPNAPGMFRQQLPKL